MYFGTLCFGTSFGTKFSTVLPEKAIPTFHAPKTGVFGTHQGSLCHRLKKLPTLVFPRKRKSGQMN